MKYVLDIIVPLFWTYFGKDVFPNEDLLKSYTNISVFPPIVFSAPSSGNFLHSVCSRLIFPGNISALPTTTTTKNGELQSFCRFASMDHPHHKNAQIRDSWEIYLQWTFSQRGRIVRCRLSWSWSFFHREIFLQDQLSCVELFGVGFALQTF